MPFCVAGMGDLLALFRCISCRFNFGADPSKPESLGAPGRVFTTGKPELACNVQQYSRESYLRRAEAEQCRVQSSMLLPVFSIPPNSKDASTSSSVALGVVEVVQTSDDMDFLPVARLLGTVLIKCGLYTSSVDQVECRLPLAATNLQLPNRTGLLEDDKGPGVGENGGSGSSDAGDVGSAEEESGQQRKELPEGGGSGGGSGEAGGSRDVDMKGSEEDEEDNDSEEEEEEEDDNDDGDDYEPGRPSGGTRKGQRRGRSFEMTRLRNKNSNSSGGTANNNGGGGRQNRYRNAKSGVKLTLADLQGQFGVGLKEAANQLGVCTTTLKRACRRHGIQRWPRRALQKVSRTLDEMERRGTIQNNMVEAVPMGSLMHPTTGQFMIPPPPMAPLSLPFEEMPVDLRWAALANMIPKLNGGSFGVGGQFTVQTGAGIVALPTPSDFSLDGAVTMTQGNGNNKNEKTLNQNGVNKGNNNAVTAGTGMTSGWDQVGTAAAAQAQAAAGGGQQRLANIVPAVPQMQLVNVPGYLRNNATPGNAKQRSSLESPFDDHSSGDLPVLQLPGGGGVGGASAPSEGPAMSLPFSQMSLPSFGPSFLAPSLLMGGDGMTHTRASGGVTMNAIAAAAAAGGGGGQRGLIDDVGLLDSTILELMLAEDSRTLVGASDEELKRMFPSPPQASPLQ
jgi:hypothetical protein